jgi:hypothetical protein
MNNEFATSFIPPDGTSKHVLNNFLQFCNNEVLTHIPYRISFVERMYLLYLAHAEYSSRLAAVNAHLTNTLSQLSNRKRKTITLQQFIKKLDPGVQEMISLKRPKDII